MHPEKAQAPRVSKGEIPKFGRDSANPRTALLLLFIDSCSAESYFVRVCPCSRACLGREIAGNRPCSSAGLGLARTEGIAGRDMVIQEKPRERGWVENSGLR